jgi:hypothetical protein
MKRLNDETYRLIYPTRKVGDTSLNVFYPIHKEVGRLIENAVVAKLEEVLKKYDRHDNTLYPSHY